MPRSLGLAHCVRHADGTAEGIWGVYALKSAFQPIFEFRDGRLLVAAYEGLLRPFRDGKPISPGVFFGAIKGEDRVHIETLARTVHLLNAGNALDSHASIFVNFDPSYFVDRVAITSALRETQLVLKEADIAPRRVVCEITEQETSSSASLSDFVTMLKDHDHRVAVDDYGAEGSDMNRIQALGPDIVKFDGEWTKKLMESESGLVLLSGMVRKFSQQKIRTVFEGIETGQQLELAEQCAVSMVQGFVLGKPQLAPTSFRDLHKDRGRTQAKPAPEPGLETGLPADMNSIRPQNPAPSDAFVRAPRRVRSFGKRGV